MLVIGCLERELKKNGLKYDVSINLKSYPLVESDFTIHGNDIQITTYL